MLTNYSVRIFIINIESILFFFPSHAAVVVKINNVMYAVCLYNLHEFSASFNTRSGSIRSSFQCRARLILSLSSL